MIETKINIRKRAIEVYEDGKLIKTFLGKYKSRKVGTHYIDYYEGERFIKKIPVDKTEPVLEETDTLKLIRNLGYNSNKKEIEVISKNGDKVIHKNATEKDWEIISGVFYRNIFMKVFSFMFLIIIIVCFLATFRIVLTKII